jgi:hypothetical protein
MKKVALLGVLAVAVFATTAQGALWYENFEDGLNGWSIWTERGSATSAAVDETPDLGDPPNTPLDLPNDVMAKVGGNSYNGGIYTTVSGLPNGIPLKIDGWWRIVSGFGGNSSWAEVIVIPDSTPPPPQDGSDYNVAANLEYKTDDFDPAGPGEGTFSGTAEVTNDGWFGPLSTGTVTVILKVGNGSGLTEVAFDDIIITPEPSSALLLGLPALALLRRRR